MTISCATNIIIFPDEISVWVFATYQFRHRLLSFTRTSRVIIVCRNNISLQIFVIFSGTIVSIRFILCKKNAFPTENEHVVVHFYAARTKISLNCYMTYYYCRSSRHKNNNRKCTAVWVHAVVRPTIFRSYFIAMFIA